MLFIDGDRFKEVNDSYGHAAGDAVLTTIAGRIRAQLRETDLVARLGGDEFAVLLAPVHGTEDVLQIADNIIDCMTQPVILPNDEAVITSLSIGIALYLITPRRLRVFCTKLTMRCIRQSIVITEAGGWLYINKSPGYNT